MTVRPFILAMPMTTPSEGLGFSWTGQADAKFPDPGTDFFKRAGIGQAFDPFPGGQFAQAMLDLDPFFPSPFDIFPAIFIKSFQIAIHPLSHSHPLLKNK